MTFKDYSPLLFLLTLALVSTQAIGQGKIYKMAQKPPKPKTGLEAFHEHVSQKVKVHKKEVSGNVFVQFVVEKDGKLSNIKVLKGIGGTNNVIIKAIQSAPRWLPGKQNGRPVRVQKVLAVRL